MYLVLALLLAAPGPLDLLQAAGYPAGPYAVGFRAVRLRDATRPWRSATDPSGASGRPVQIALWQPAEPGSGVRLTVADLILADATGGLDAAVWGAARPGALAAARATFDAGAERPLTDPEWERALGLASLARSGATALRGRRALILLQGGLGTRSYLLAPVAELLASHGYVVAALATDGASEEERLAFDLAGVRAQVDDMSFALRWLRDRAEVDPGRVGHVAWSVGGVSQAILRREKPGDVRAAVSLDSGIGYAYGVGLLRQAGGSEAGPLPLLHLDAGRTATVPKDDGFLRAQPPGSVRRVRLEDLRHADFTLPYGAGRWAATGQAPPAASRTLGRGLLAFLAAHLPER